MTFVSVLTQRCLTAPLPVRSRLTRLDVIQAIRRIALDLDADATALGRFTAVLGETRGPASFQALHRLVMTLCCQGRRPFVVGHPNSPLPSVTERHVLTLLAARQANQDEEVDIRLTTLLPAPWRATAQEDLAAVAKGLACTGVALAARLEPAPPRCRGWANNRPTAPRTGDTITATPVEETAR